MTPVCGDAHEDRSSLEQMDWTYTLHVLQQRVKDKDSLTGPTPQGQGIGFTEAFLVRDLRGKREDLLFLE